MPTYEYRCSDCEHQFEEFLPKIPKDDEVLDIKCPNCKSETVIKIFCSTGSHFVLKGSGWYKDGYSNAKKPNVDKIVSSSDD